MKPLSWLVTDTKDPAAMLAKLRTKTRHLLTPGRYAEYTPRWRVEVGFDREFVAPVSEEEDRRNFEAHFGFDRVQAGMELGGLPWGARGVQFCQAVALWAERALLHIIDLEGDLTTERALVVQLRERGQAEGKRADRAEDALLSEQQLRAATRSAASANADRLSMEIKALEATLAEAEQQAQVAAVRLAASESRERAWELSATAANRSLEILRAAAHIPVGDPGQGIARLPPDPRRK